MFYTVYKTTNLINGKIYIGTHQTEDLDDDYLGSGKLLFRAIKKYGRSVFKREYISIHNSYEEMMNMETILVNEEFISREDTYNICVGGVGGNLAEYNRIHNAERNKKRWSNPGFAEKEKLRFSELSKKLWNDPEYRAAHSGENNVWYGKHHTDETKKVISLKNSIHQFGSKNSQFGKKWVHNKVIGENKSINPLEIDNYLNDGWELGRIGNYKKFKL